MADSFATSTQKRHSNGPSPHLRRSGMPTPEGEEHGTVPIVGFIGRRRIKSVKEIFDTSLTSFTSHDLLQWALGFELCPKSQHLRILPIRLYRIRRLLVILQPLFRASDQENCRIRNNGRMVSMRAVEAKPFRFSTRLTFERLLRAKQ